jgi:hypothetical protein
MRRSIFLASLALSSLLPLASEGCGSTVTPGTGGNGGAAAATTDTAAIATTAGTTGTTSGTATSATTGTGMGGAGTTTSAGTGMGGAGGSPGDPCKSAVTKLTMCINAMSGTGSGGMVMCTGDVLCQATCINNASCAQLQDAFSGMPTNVSKKFLDCITGCVQPSGVGGAGGANTSGGGSDPAGGGSFNNTTTTGP